MVGGAVLRPDCFCKDNGERCEGCGLYPFVLDDLESVSGLACSLGFQHDGNEGHEGTVR